MSDDLAAWLRSQVDDDETLSESDYDIMISARKVRDAAAEITRLRAELATARREGMGWQPIETAPKDGTLILGYRHSSLGDCDVYVTQWEKREDKDDEREYSWRILHADIYGDPIYDDRLTHWAPIPALPKGEGKP